MAARDLLVAEMARASEESCTINAPHDFFVNSISAWAGEHETQLAVNAGTFNVAWRARALVAGRETKRKRAQAESLRTDPSGTLSSSLVVRLSELKARVLRNLREVERENNNKKERRIEGRENKIFTPSRAHIQCEPTASAAELNQRKFSRYIELAGAPAARLRARAPSDS